MPLMNPLLDALQPYPFERLRALLAEAPVTHKGYAINLSIGEPKHPAPDFVLQVLQAEQASLSTYPTTAGLLELRQAIAQWCTKRFALPEHALNPQEQVLPVNGSREALFSFTQAVIDRTQAPIVISPNPFYQIYEGATLLAGAQPYYLPCLAAQQFQPDYAAVPEHIWQRTQLVFLCAPDNPTGAVASFTQLQQLIALADRYDFVIAADECYSELYLDEAQPPVGLLGACARLGRLDFARCVVFHSLSKRSNLPGMRSGFVAGDARIVQRFLRYRTYHGCAMPIPTQLASRAAWQDEEHVAANRALYRAKFAAVVPILQSVLSVQAPTAGFYLWVPTPIDDTLFARTLHSTQQVTVVPGSYLSRSVAGVNPGSGYMRIALVAPLADCVEAAQRIRMCTEELKGCK